MAEFKTITLPQDPRLVDDGGNVSPSWLGTVSKLAALPLALNSYADETNQTIADAEQTLGARILVLESNLQQEPIADIDTSPVLTIDPTTYTASQITAIKDRLVAAETKINTILAGLRLAKIIAEE